MGAEEELRKQLASMPDGAVVSLVTDLDNYLPVIKAVVSFASESSLKCIYVTSTVPARVVVEQLAGEGVKTDELYFVDAISMMVGSATENPKTIFLESPTMLESIMLKVEVWLRRLGGAKGLVFLDSLSSLAMHNDPSLLSEFVHLFVNHMRGKGVRSLVLTVSGQTPDELENMARLICDETIVLRAEGEGKK
ncbi:MAG: hypothetical protein QXH42_07295 [Thermoplasmata archaeon]